MEVNLGQRQHPGLGWLAGARTIGVTAGASAPPALVAQIVAALAGLGEVQTKEVAVATESVQFGLPKELKRLWPCHCARACGSERTC